MPELKGVRLGTSQRAKTHIVRQRFRKHVVTHCGRFSKQRTFPLSDPLTRICRHCVHRWSGS